MSSQYYEVEDVQETKFEPDNYGNRWYSVKFRGVADSALWKAKARPDPNAKVYGHIERTESGKSWRFKRDQVPEGVTPENAVQSPSEPQTSSTPAHNIVMQLDRIEKKLDKLLGIDTPEVDKIKEAVDEVYPVDEQEEINLSDIPF